MFLIRKSVQDSSQQVNISWTNVSHSSAFHAESGGSRWIRWTKCFGFASDSHPDVDKAMW